MAIGRDRGDRVPCTRGSVNYLMRFPEPQTIRIVAVDALLQRTFDAEQRHFWFRGFKRFVAPLLEQATAGIARPRLLDAGCGTGANLPFLENYGTPFGLELFWRGLAFGHQRGLQRLTQGSVTALPFATS